MEQSTLDSKRVLLSQYTYRLPSQRVGAMGSHVFPLVQIAEPFASWQCVPYDEQSLEKIGHPADALAQSTITLPSQVRPGWAAQ